MMLAWLYVANIVLLSRLPLVTRDSRLPTWQIIVACAVQELALLAFAPAVSVAVFGGFLILMSVIWWALERTEGSSLLVRRLFLLVVYFALLGVFFSPSIGLTFRPSLKADVLKLARYFLPVVGVMKVNWIHFGSHAFGLLLCLSEANLVVRCLIDALELRPEDVGKTKGSDIPSQIEYNRGRIIGLLERIMLFALISLGQFSAIGFVVGAKALARFQSLEDRDFAEYFLVGTLTSLVTAGAIALFVQQVLL